MPFDFSPQVETKPTVADVLRRAKAWLDGPEKMTFDSCFIANNDDLSLINQEHLWGSATRACPHGACWLVAGYEEGERAAEYLRRAGYDFDVPIDYSRNKRRGWEIAQSAFDRAIELAERDGR